MNLTIEDLIKYVKTYNIEGLDEIRKAYDYASLLHKNQRRESGEPYITHPLSVALILAELHADKDTICAALLHDTIEDTGITKQDIEENFNGEIANLVYGVTKISKLNFSTSSEEYSANTRKILLGINEDVRIIIIKLADRLHNMRTLGYKKILKQQENAIETMDVFVPLAYYIGAYRIKSELEDLSLSYLYPDKFKQLQNKLIKIEEESVPCLQEVLGNIEAILNDRNIPHEIKMRTKNIYGLYKASLENKNTYEIHDLLSLKIMVDNISDCYQTLGIVHSKYNPVNNMFKDYIYNPKSNLYRSIHTTVFGPNDRLIQTQIRTFDMDKIASFGLTAYWDLKKGNVRNEMQEDLRKHSQFLDSLVEMDNVFVSNRDFVSQVGKELFSDNVYVYTTLGDIICLPADSTVIDFAYKIHSDIGNKAVGAFVNDKLVGLNYILRTNDRVKIITDELSTGPKEEWLDWVNTTTAKKKIKEFMRNE